MADIDELHNAQDIATLDSLLVDVTAAKTAIDTLVAKLNLDAWVTDTDYVAMAALTTTT